MRLTLEDQVRHRRETRGMTSLEKRRRTLSAQGESRRLKLATVHAPFCVMCIEPMCKAAQDGLCGWCRAQLKAVKP